jgi:hypothetical protein
MIEKSKLIREIEFRWLTRKIVILMTSDDDDYIEDKVLQYRVQRGDGFRGWSDWQDVEEEREEDQ